MWKTTTGARGALWGEAAARGESAVASAAGNGVSEQRHGGALSWTRAWPEEEVDEVDEGAVEEGEGVDP